MQKEQKVFFTWENQRFEGIIEKEYENSYLICVHNPSKTMIDRYTDRMIVSKHSCKLALD